jgi:hypothetical protein
VSQIGLFVQQAFGVVEQYYQQKEIQDDIRDEDG